MRRRAVAFPRAQRRIGHVSPTTTLGIHRHVVNDEGHGYPTKVAITFPFTHFMGIEHSLVVLS